MFDYSLTRDKNGNVRYLMKLNDREAVTGTMPHKNANAIIMSRKNPHASAEYSSYPITGDDKFFFDGKCSGESPAIGADGLPILATGAEITDKPVLKKRARAAKKGADD